MAHVTKEIPSNVYEASKSIDRKTFPDLNAALEFVKHANLGSSERLDISVKRNSNHALEVEINSKSEISKEISPPTRIRIPAGLYDLFW